MQRLRITFAKTSAMRFTGHLDLHRVWERTFRRAELPLAYSQGYNPHPRLNLAAALPLGFTSQAEVMDAWLEHSLPVAQTWAALERALPPGISLCQIEEVALNLPALQTQVEAAEYLVTLLDELPEMATRLETLMNSEHLPRRRRGKDYDLRPLILELRSLPPEADGLQRLFMRLVTKEGATGRPDEVVEALGGAADAARVHRLRLILSG